MWEKRGLNQVDWAISIAVFMLYLSWFFILIKPYYSIGTDRGVTEELKDAIEEKLTWEVNKTPLIIESDIKASKEPVRIPYRLNIEEPHFAFTDNRHFSLFRGEISFLADLETGKNVFWLASSKENYTTEDTLTDLYATAYSSSVTNMRANYDDGLIKRIYYDGDIAIDDFEVKRQGENVAVNNTEQFTSPIMAAWESDTENDFNHTSQVFAYNQRVYNNIYLDPFIDERVVELEMEVNDRPYYYADNLNFGKIETEGQCATFDKDEIYIYNDESAIIIMLKNESDIVICYSDEDTLKVNLRFAVEGEGWYNIFFETYDTIRNGMFDEGEKYWSFTDNINPYRTCSSKEGTLVMIEDDSHPFLAGDWDNSSKSGVPVMGFGANKSIMNGTGGAYDGRLVSDPFVIPEDVEFLHIWRNYKAVSLDSHYNSTLGYNLPDAIYLELRNADTDGILMLIDSYEGAGLTYPTAEEKIINVSQFRGQNAEISLNVIGHRWAVPDDCMDGTDDDALVQLDDVYFSDASGNRINPGFNYSRIRERIEKGEYEYIYGYPVTIRGLSEDALNISSLEEYEALKERLGIPYSLDFLTKIYKVG